MKQIDFKELHGKKQTHPALRHVPKVISKEICDYADNVALKFSRYLFVWREKKEKLGYCTHCRTTSVVEKYYSHNEYGVCPECGSDCLIKAAGRGHSKLSDYAYFVYYEKSLVDPKVIVALGITVCRNYRESYKDIDTKYHLDVVYVFEMGKSVMLTESWNGKAWEFTENKTVYSLESRKLSGFYNNITCSKNSIEVAVRETPFQYSCWEQFFYTNHNSKVLNDDMVKFFNLYSKYPCIEYLIKMGFDEVVCDKLYGRYTFGAINWRGKTVFKVLRLDRHDVKEIQASSVKVDPLFLKLYQINKKDKSRLSIQEILKLSKNRIIYGYLQDLQPALKYMSLKKVMAYVNKQFEAQKDEQISKRTFWSVESVITTYKDYIHDCKKLSFDMKSSSVLFPKNLHRAHQNTIKQIKIQANEMLNKKFSNRVISLEKYYFENEALLIRPVKSIQELIDEGKTLHHCVGTYADRHANGKTSIFLIRKQSHPNKPYFTVEVRNDVIIQVRGRDNCSPNANVQMFIADFEKAKLKKKKVRIAVSA